VKETTKDDIRYGIEEGGLVTAGTYTSHTTGGPEFRVGGVSPELRSEPRFPKHGGSGLGCPRRVAAHLLLAGSSRLTKDIN
jgi:hypothetical protein